MWNVPTGGALLRTVVVLALGNTVLGCRDGASGGDATFQPATATVAPTPDPSKFTLAGELSGTLGAAAVNATASSTAGALVRRDDTGSVQFVNVNATRFVGSLQGKADSSGYSLGKMAAPISLNVATTLSLGAGDVMSVRPGTTANFDSGVLPANPLAGRRMTFFFDGPSVTLRSDSRLRLAHGGDYRSVANGNDNFTLLFTGAPSNVWIEISRAVAVSRIRATEAAGMDLVDNGETVLVFEAEAEDRLAEYETQAGQPTSAGTFKAVQGGVYTVMASVASNVSTWQAGEQCALYVRVNGTNRAAATASPVNNTRCTLSVTESVTMAPDDQMTFHFSTNRSLGGSDIALSAGEGALNRLSIVRQP